MANKNRPIQPPEIDGYTFIKHLNSGGFADVFLYEKHLPKMQVAIKVMYNISLTAEDTRRFTSEANSMAALASHPFIVPILGADTTRDKRPYIVMQYYSGGNLSLKVKKSPLNLADSLKLGIEIASAIETAHRFGILHRDIKPGNILLNEYGQPGLTDFGISFSAENKNAGNDEGLSIPWSPPEAFNDNEKPSALYDVYSLGATIYTFLTGRSPFEIPNGPNRQIDLINRITKMPLPPTSRTDVPIALEKLLAQTMSKDPSYRPPSAYELALELQAIEIALKLKPTHILVNDQTALVEETTQNIFEKTMYKPPLNVDPQSGEIDQGDIASKLEPRQRQKANSSSISKHIQVLEDENTTIFKSSEENTDLSQETNASKKNSHMTAGIAVVAIIILIVLGAYFLLSSNTPNPSSVTTTGNITITTPPNAVYTVVPTPTNLNFNRSGTSVTVSWSNPSPLPGDVFQWNLTNVSNNTQTYETSKDHITLNNIPTSLNPCISVILVRSDGRSSQALAGCEQ